MKKLKEKLFYKVVVTDKKGKVVAVREGEARSFLAQYNGLLASCFDLAAKTVKNTAGVDKSATGSGVWYTVFNINAAVGVTDYGIRIGTGNTAVTISDYALKTPVAEGSSSDQMEHQASVLATNVTVSDPDCTFTIVRIMINSGSTTITVRELGIYCISRDSGNNECYFCIARDVITAVAVPAGGAITVTYTWKISE